MMPNVVPKVVESDEKCGREARISRKSDGSPIGVAVFFTADELVDLGVNPADVDSVRMWVHEGEINFESVNSADG
jgi:hypothetical protein